MNMKSKTNNKNSVKSEKKQEQIGHCKDCVAFGTPFCTFHHTGMVFPEDYACSDFWSLEKRLNLKRRNVLQKVFVEVARIE